MTGHDIYLASASPEEEERVYVQLATLKDHLPMTNQNQVEEFLLGAGANGIAFAENPKVSMAFDCDLAVFFQEGNMQRGVSDEHESPAHEVLARYRDSAGDGDLGFLTDCAHEFVVVVFDKRLGIVSAARDANGSQALFWGTSNFGDNLFFSTDKALLSKHCVEVDVFPPGTIFRSKQGEIANGELTMLNMAGGGDDWEELSDSEDEDDERDFLARDKNDYCKNDAWVPESPARAKERLSKQSTKTDYHGAAA